MKYVLIDGEEYVNKSEFKKRLDNKLIKLEIDSPKNDYIEKCRAIIKES